MFIIFLLSLVGVNAQTIVVQSGSLNLCPGQSVTLKADNTITPTPTYQWLSSSNNGTTWDTIPTATNQTYTTSTAMLYAVLVNSTQYTYVTVTSNPKPDVGFTFSPTNQCSNVPVNFSNTTTVPSTYTWNFGDANSSGNNTATATNPAHTFIGTTGNATQNFSVKLVATSNVGCKDSIIETVTTKQLPHIKLGGSNESIYNGSTFFRDCSMGGSASLTFINQSNSNSTNTNYKIVWGDGSPDYTSTNFPTPINHSFPLGTTTVLYIISNSNCTDTATYYAFIGSNPAVGFVNPGNSTICTNSSLTFPISNVASNSLGTTYTVTFNDGSAPVTFSHPPPSDVSHLFTTTSCGTNSGTYNNSFSATITASNPCLTSTASVVPIYVSQKPNASFSITPKDTICKNSNITFTNTSGNNSYVNAPNCSDGKVVWEITPATGWTINNGNLGNTYSSADPNFWVSGTASISINFNTVGTYSVKFKAGNPVCGMDSSIKVICVNPTPTASFSLSNTSGCSPLVVTANGSTNTPNCGTNIFVWNTTYTPASNCTPNTSSVNYVGGTSSSSANPQLQFNNPGTYNVNLYTVAPNNACTSPITTQQIVVKSKPNVSAISGNSSVCQNGTLNPNVTVGNCNSNTTPTYVWSFTGASPTTSTQQTPGAITFTNSGSQTMSVDVTNECGTSNVTKTINVTSAPSVTPPSDKTFCAGIATGAINFSGTGTSYSWTNSNTAIGLNASGTTSSPTIPSFNATNNGTSPITATISVTPISGCNGVPQTFTITINPKPEKPSVVRPVLYCLNETPTALSATSTGSNTLNWYDNSALNNPSATASTPITSTAGTTLYYVNQENSLNCKSDTAIIPVIVSPIISNNVIASNQTICSGSTPSTLTQVGALSGGGGNYTYQWQFSTDGGATWNNIATATNNSYAPGNISVTTMYRRIVMSYSCTDTSAAVTISIQGSLSNINISAAQTICSGTVPLQLNGDLPVGGSGTYTYTWESSLNNSTWTTIPSANGQDYQPTALTTSTYFRRKTIAGTCSAYSSSILITVNPIPVVTNKQNLIVCANSSVNSISFSSTPTTNVTFAWDNNNTNIGLAASGTGSLPTFISTNNSNPKIPEEATITVTPTYTNAGKSCIGNAMSFKIIVLPNISIATIPDENVCSGTTINAITPTHDAGTFSGSTLTYNWTVSGSGTTLTNGTGTVIPSFNTNNNGNSNVITTITVTPIYNYNGKSCNGNSSSFTVTIKPSTPTANAGADTVLCAATSYNLQAILIGASTGVWSQVSGSAVTITSPTSANSPITGLQQNNTYKFVWFVSGVPGCSSTTDTIEIINYTALVNLIDNTPVTICATQTATIAGQTPTGGNGFYIYQWQQSTDGGVTWTDIIGQTNATLNFTPTTTLLVRRKVVSYPCIEYSSTTSITVQPGISNNTIASNQNICINNAASIIVGSTPSGGDGIYTYQWQQSTNGGVTWTNINLATSKDFDPGVLTQTTMYRRITNTTLCFGSQGNSSAPVTITINPDAKALYTFTKNKSCTPFNINSSIIHPTLYPSQNASYNWYANGVSIGNGTVFPGYILSTPGDSITIKLLAVSKFGCKNDSIEYKFYSIPKPATAFTLSDTLGCGPLTVSFNNTTPNISLFNYVWNFGNGVTSNTAQPGSITFATNPNYTDTTYIVKLHALNTCDTTTTTKFITVKSKPKAIFTPNKSVGCSPMTVQFSNLSKGNGVSYIWNFGDGSPSVPIATKSSQTHTFITGVQDTFNVKLIAINDCGNDTLNYTIVVSPNQVHLDFAINGNQAEGCKPHTVQFVNASSGANSFQWNFGDGNTLNTTKNIDTVTHTFLQPGTYHVVLLASNGCSDTTSTELIKVVNSPIANFAFTPNSVCIGDTIHFNNLSDTTTSVVWNFKDGFTSAVNNPQHSFSNAGIYNVQLKAIRQYNSGLVCIDTISKPVTIVSKLSGNFTVTDTLIHCTPFTATLTNLSLPSALTVWTFTPGGNDTGNIVTHTFNQNGTYQVKMLATALGGCKYEAEKTIHVQAPVGNFSYDHGFICGNTPVKFSANTQYADSLIWNFGDGTIVVTSNVSTVYHTYNTSGLFIPKVTLKSNYNCNVLLNGVDTIKVDYVVAGFKNNVQQKCGYSTVQFTDTSRIYFTPVTYYWEFGDGTFSNLKNPSHVYTSTNTWAVKLTVTSVSGCISTINKNIFIKVDDKPNASILAPTTACTQKPVLYQAQINANDSITVMHWTFSNGFVTNGVTVNNTYTSTGNFTATLIAGTVNGCMDTVSKSIIINPSPAVIASNDVKICKGQSVQISASGATTYSWSPINSTLSCTNCPNPIANPLVTTLYTITGTNNFGCTNTDSVLVTVAQPIHLSVSNNDTICIGQSSQLSVSGGATYIWSPNATLNNSTSSAPIATPTVTTKYRVIGFDGYNCFQDTAYVTVAVGKYPTITLGADKTLATGTPLPLVSQVTNGPITKWVWGPSSASLNCFDCPQPIATIKKEICYTVEAYNLYKCVAKDTLCVKVFCENSQVFIPNAFTPDADGVNDVLMVRAQGIKTIKHFRVFNRWGQVVFDKSNFPPNDVAFGWDGNINGKPAAPDVYVYTCEVVCENDVTYTYKGNVAILK
ncbi:MAG: PKD domain-containing protein [Chitinophagales bacterium]|nr:PKD domain-containing protein [Chitinophagales bacterium]